MKSNSKFKVQIPEPCHEDWRQMTPAEKGRHCASCQKTVVDFTRKTDREIIHFLQNKKESTCGRFASTQIDRELIHSNIKPGPSKSAVYAMLFGSMLAGGVAQAQTHLPVKGKVAIEQQQTVVGRIANPNITPPPPPITGDTILHVTPPEYIEEMGEVELLGDIAFEEQNSVTGLVSDEDGEPIPFGTVQIKNTNIGTSTDLEGRYSIDLPQGMEEVILVFSYVGYDKKEVILNKGQIELNTILTTSFIHVTMGIIAMPEPQPKRLINQLVDKLPNLNFNLVFKKRKDKKKKDQNVKTFDPLSIHLLKNEAKPIHKYVLKEEAKIAAFPNPFVDQISAELDIPESAKYKIRLISIDGKVLIHQEETLKKGKVHHQINTSDYGALQSGQYILHIEGNEFSQSIMLFKEKSS